MKESCSCALCILANMTVMRGKGHKSGEADAVRRENAPLNETKRDWDANTNTIGTCSPSQRLAFSSPSPSTCIYHPAISASYHLLSSDYQRPIPHDHPRSPQLPTAAFERRVNAQPDLRSLITYAPASAYSRRSISVCGCLEL